MPMEVRVAADRPRCPGTPVSGPRASARSWCDQLPCHGLGDRRHDGRMSVPEFASYMADCPRADQVAIRRGYAERWSSPSTLTAA